MARLGHTYHCDGQGRTGEFDFDALEPLLTLD